MFNLWNLQPFYVRCGRAYILGKGKKQKRDRNKYYYNETTQRLNKIRRLRKYVHLLRKKKTKLDSKEITNKVQNEIDRIEKVLETL